MKVKLLKRIRKQYKIFYNIKGVVYRCPFSDELERSEDKYLVVYDTFLRHYENSFKTKQECLDYILSTEKRKYSNYIFNDNKLIWYKDGK